MKNSLNNIVTLWGHLFSARSTDEVESMNSFQFCVQWFERPTPSPLYLPEAKEHGFRWFKRDFVKTKNNQDKTKKCKRYSTLLHQYILRKTTINPFSPLLWIISKMNSNETHLSVYWVHKYEWFPQWTQLETITTSRVNPNEKNHVPVCWIHTYELLQ